MSSSLQVIVQFREITLHDNAKIYKHSINYLPAFDIYQRSGILLDAKFREYDSVELCLMCTNKPGNLF